MDKPAPDQPVVLVVDDEALLRMYASDLLEDAGYRVVEAADADSALKIMEHAADVRVVFTDVQMPGRLDGVELAQRVHERWPKVLLLVTSGGLTFRDEDLPDHGRFLAKPYDGSVVAMVDDLLATGHKK